ncbi:hypothetical protein CASFOL_040801 [Castilleja foliolosa]|uniref:RING-CH-type domain-containing protein n=1 Tax=Castilleja foliolosa TaxID=1961234 RepID=A0ABD3BCN1_9LAMI
MDLESGEINRGAGDNSKNSEAAIAIGEGEIAARSNVTSNGVRTESSSCVIDIDGKENQRVCRICHLSAKESGKTPVELMELGCACKGELGVAHLHCAEAWFRVRGNRTCEICGQTAKNITGVGDAGFMEEWNETGSGAAFASSSDENRSCLRGQPLCNFLMACLVIAFILPWFFRVNMF